jgi:hypothetical protein
VLQTKVSPHETIGIDKLAPIGAGRTAAELTRCAARRASSCTPPAPIILEPASRPHGDAVKRYLQQNRRRGVDTVSTRKFQAYERFPS